MFFTRYSCRIFLLSHGVNPDELSAATASSFDKTLLKSFADIGIIFCGDGDRILRIPYPSAALIIFPKISSDDEDIASLVFLLPSSSNHNYSLGSLIFEVLNVLNPHSYQCRVSWNFIFPWNGCPWLFPANLLLANPLVYEATNNRRAFVCEKNGMSSIIWEHLSWLLPSNSFLPLWQELDHFSW